MARLNVEMDVFSDDRFLELVAILGDQEKAVGRLILFWSVAQKYWKRDRQMIPLEVFKRRDWQVLVDVGLAEIRGSEVYAKGSEQSFDWLLERQEAGRRGANKTNELRHGKTQQTSANVGKARPPSPSPSLITSSKEEVSDELSLSAPAVSKKKAKPKTEGAEVWEAYADAFRNRYLVDPIRNQTTNSQCKKLAADIGKSRAIDVVRFYLKSNHPYYERQSHPIGLCLNDVQTLCVQMSGGRTPVSNQPQYVNPEDLA